VYEFVDQRLVRRVEDVRRGVTAGFVRTRRKGQGVGLDIERFDEQALLRAPAHGVEGAAGEFALDAAAPIVESGRREG
jgi:hypothetical protein